MYGLVNKGIKELVTHHYGEDKWQLILEKSGVDDDYFISNQSYDDAITFNLAMASSEIMKIPLSDILESFGEWWILKTGIEKYGSLMKAGGSNLKEFLMGLPTFHNRVILMYPKLTTPEFKITDIKEQSICIHYISKREGLQDFVRGLLIGLGKLYKTPIEIQLLEARNKGNAHEVFKVNWSS